MTTIKVEEKLFENRYRVDEGRAHIAIKRPEICREQCETPSCTWCCPAGCYTLAEDGSVILSTDGCLECGTCRLLCSEHHNVEWSYPRGGYGVLYKFG
ncbi:MAG: ferredoxin family protein [Burkholderiaceae bacterium]|nr:ferredoxin family protein [Burkholderiaceae bacterium]